MARTRKTTAVATRGNTAAANIDAELAAEAQAIAENIQVGTGNVISLKDKQFTFPDGLVTTDPIELVIVDYAFRNQLFKGKYDPKNPSPPVCWAINRIERDLAPSANVPNPESSACGACPNNQFGSDGDSKACKNQLVLAVVAPDSGPDDPVFTLAVPPTSLKAAKAYIATIAKLHGSAPVKFVTEIALHPDSSYSKLMFKILDPNENYAAHFARRAEAEMVLMAEPEPAPEAAKPKTRGRGRGRRAA